MRSASEIEQPANNKRVTAQRHRRLPIAQCARRDRTYRCVIEVVPAVGDAIHGPKPCIAVLLWVARGSYLYAPASLSLSDISEWSMIEHRQFARSEQVAPARAADRLPSGLCWTLIVTAGVGR